MNNSTQAQKGFKTFLLTLSISLIVFSVVYYIITNSSLDQSGLPADVAGEKSDQVKVEAEAVVPEEDSAFQKLASTQMNVESRAVLSGSDTQTTESTTAVPDTGVVGITFGLITASLLFALAMVVVARDPRKLAIESFEKQTIRRL